MSTENFFTIVIILVVVFGFWNTIFESAFHRNIKNKLKLIPTADEWEKFNNSIKHLSESFKDQHDEISALKKLRDEEAKQGNLVKETFHELIKNNQDEMREWRENQSTKMRSQVDHFQESVNDVHDHLNKITDQLLVHRRAISSIKNNMIVRHEIKIVGDHKKTLQKVVTQLKDF